jgi:hypothetical protein
MLTMSVVIPISEHELSSLHSTHLLPFGICTSPALLWMYSLQGSPTNLTFDTSSLVWDMVGAARGRKGFLPALLYSFLLLSCLSLSPPPPFTSFHLTLNTLVPLFSVSYQSDHPLTYFTPKISTCSLSTLCLLSTSQPPLLSSLPTCPFPNSPHFPS